MDMLDMLDMYHLVMTNIAMENHHLWWNCPMNNVIFHSVLSVYQRVTNHAITLW